MEALTQGRTIHRDDQDLVTIVPDEQERRRLLSVLDDKGFISELQNGFYEIENDGERLIEDVRRTVLGVLLNPYNVTRDQIIDALSDENILESGEHS